MGAGISEKSPRIGNRGAIAATSTSDDAGPCANCQGLSQIQRPRPHRGSRPAIWSREFTILFVSSSGYETRAALQVSWSSQRIPLSSFALTSGPTPAAAGALRGMRGSPNAVPAFPPSTCALGGREVKAIPDSHSVPGRDNERRERDQRWKTRTRQEGGNDATGQEDQNRAQAARSRIGRTRRLRPGRNLSRPPGHGARKQDANNTRLARQAESCPPSERVAGQGGQAESSRSFSMIIVSTQRPSSRPCSL